MVEQDSVQPRVSEHIAEDRGVESICGDMGPKLLAFLTGCPNGTAISIGFGLPVNTVGEMGKLPEGLPSLALPDVPLSWETLQIIAPYSLTMAAVGLLESLLTAQIVDDMTHSDSDKRREGLCCTMRSGNKLMIT